MKSIILGLGSTSCQPVRLAIIAETSFEQASLCKVVAGNCGPISSGEHARLERWFRRLAETRFSFFSISQLDRQDARDSIDKKQGLLGKISNRVRPETAA
jgi:hypothetical protein